MAHVTEGTARNGEIELPWIRHEVEGGDPLLLVNGLSSPLVSYEEEFVAAFNDLNFDVVRFDNRDAGKATLTEGGYLLADQAADAITVMDAVGWDSANIFGVSMGGMIVQQMGIDHAARLRSITSVMSNTGNPKFGRSTDEAAAGLMKPSPTEREAWLVQRVETEKIWASPAQWTPETSRAKGERLFDYGMHPTKVKHQYNAIVNSPRREDALRNVQVPTLVMHGTEDTLITLSGGERTAEVMPNSTFVVLEGMGHDIPQDYWPEVCGHVRSLVDGLTPS